MEATRTHRRLEPDPAPPRTARGAWARRWAPLLIGIAAAPTGALAAAQHDARSADAPKSALRVLFVGHDPEAPQVPFPQLATERTHELYRERTPAFEAFLNEHFEDVRVVYGADYDAAMSEQVDVTLFDARPKKLTEAVREVDEATGALQYEPASYLPHDFSRPALMIAENSPLIGEPLGLKLDWL